MNKAYHFPWRHMFDQLQEFHRLHGHANVPLRSGPLGAWVVNQRRSLDMTSERRALLDSIHFSWNPHVEQWNAMFAQLQAFQAEHGHTCVPQGSQLGNWVHNQRYHCPDDDRRALLDSINFDWDPDTARWANMFAHLQAFQVEHGHTIVLRNYRIQGSPLGTWVMSQRRGHGMTPERRALLDSINFSWNPDEDRWNHMFAQLQAFQAEHGHTDVPGNPATRLSRWVYKQRAHCSNDERRARLDSIGFRW